MIDIIGSKQAFFLSTLTGFGYVFYLATDWSGRPWKAPYHKLFKTSTYCWHLAVACVIGLIGYYLCQQGLNATGFFAPIIFLIVLWIVDWLVQLLANRHILITTRWDKKSKEYKWYLDGLMSIVLMSISLCAPIIIHELITGKP